jgi:hypothetical protein
MTSPFTPEMRALIADYRRPDPEAQRRLAVSVSELRAALLAPAEAWQARLQAPDLSWLPAVNDNRAPNSATLAGLAMSRLVTFGRE